MSSFIMYFPLVLQFITCFVVIDERCLYKETFTNFVTYIDLYVDVLFLDMCRAGHHLVVLIDLIMVIFLIHTLKCGWNMWLCIYIVFTGLIDMLMITAVK